MWVMRPALLLNQAVSRDGLLTWKGWSSVKASYYLKTQITIEPGTIAVPTIELRCFICLDKQTVRFALGRRGKARRLTYVGKPSIIFFLVPVPDKQEKVPFVLPVFVGGSLY